MATLGLGWRHRPGATGVGKFGGSQTARDHLDFLIDGVFLYDLLDLAALDQIGVLGWRDHGVEAENLRQLLLEAPAPLPGGRRMIFVCPECGDLGCGALTANVSQVGKRIVWKDFGYENSYDEGMSDFETFKAIGPFWFDIAQYRSVLEGYLSELWG